jgi:GT2 family glycosyltransferase/glycosyltransferase involved in cell wall biosynthesis
MKKLVSIITVNYNGKNFLETFFNSLLSINNDAFSYEIIVVDNLSKDDSVNFVRTKFPEIKVIENNINNYSKAINLGIKNARGQYIAVLNNDTIVEKNWLKGLMEIIDQDEKIGVVQSKILFSDKQNINSAGVEEIKDFHFRDIGFGEWDIGKYNEIKELYYFTGVSFLIKRKCVEAVGEFDEDFLMYLENIDYSIRCRDLGWKIFYSPNSVVYRRYHDIASSDLGEYFSARNRLLLLGKRFPQKLAGSIKTSHFYLKREHENLYHSLIQATKKLAENNDTETVKQTLTELSGVLPEIFGPQKAFNFFSQLKVVLGLRRIRVGIYDHAFHFPGGGQRYVAELAKILQDRYDVTYIANKEISLEKYLEWFDIDLSKCKLKIIKIPFYEERGRDYIEESMVIHQIINPFDVIGAESLHYDIFINANMLGKVRPLSNLSIFICHFPDRDKERFFSVDKYDYIITNSDYTTYWLNRKWGLDTTMRLYPPVNMFNDESDIGKKEKMILSVARFEIGGSKKQLEMIDAFSDLCEWDQDIKEGWKLVLAGGTSKKNPYYRRVKQKLNKKTINIEIMTNLNNSEIKQLYREAAIFWHACGLNEKNPQLIEHFGMTTVEAMQNYCVPIVIDGGGQREIVEQGISGFRFKTKEELLSYTLKLINDDNLRKKMARNAYDRSQDFTKDEFKKKALEFFSDIENRLRGGEATEVKESTTHD